MQLSIRLIKGDNVIYYKVYRPTDQFKTKPLVTSQLVRTQLHEKEV